MTRVSKLRVAARKSGFCRAWLLVLASVQFAPGAVVAETLGQVTAVDAELQVIEIGGEVLTVKANLEVIDAADGNDGEAGATMPWHALSAGDYVLFERDGTVLTGVQRVSPDSIDAPPVSSTTLRVLRAGNPG